MKQLNTSWLGVTDPTGYLFSFAKSLSCAVKNSPWREYAEDIVATSGFAFRMWVSEDFCPSATSIWSFDEQKPWVENGGLTCDYAGRYWGEDSIEEQRRLEAVEIIKKSIDGGVPAVSWDIGVPEWGLITGYDDEAKEFSTLAVNASNADPTSPEYNPGKMPYDVLGKREIPILSVLTVTGTSGKTREEIFNGTIKLAVNHLQGGEWCDNKSGLAAYPALIKHFEETFNPDVSWNMEYFLGTYGGLKYYAWKYFEKTNEKLGAVYKSVYENWLQAFEIKTREDVSSQNVSEKISAKLESAYESEKEALAIMKEMG